MVAFYQHKQKKSVQRERWKLLRELTDALDEPMTALAFVWLALVIIDFVYGLGRAGSIASNVIWVAFIVHFVLEFWIAPSKLTYLRQNWLTAIALLLPAFRVLRVLRALRLVAHAGRSLTLLRLLTSLNRGMRALERSMGHSGLGYVVALTLLVNFGGAAGMYAFENPAALQSAGITDERGITSYGEAVWWTAMTLTTLGSDYFPKTSEGRFLCWLLAVYAFAIFGYITALVARFLLHGKMKTPTASSSPDLEIASVRQEIAALRREIANTRRLLGNQAGGSALNPATSR
jgi:voltage-gated potassium channel